MPLPAWTLPGPAKQHSARPVRRVKRLKQAAMPQLEQQPFWGSQVCQIDTSAVSQDLLSNT